MARAAADNSAFSAAPSAPPAVVADRAKAALLGALLADVATMPLHWHYDQGQIMRKVKRQPDGPFQALVGMVRCWARHERTHTARARG
jgi:hypothetical protein